MKGAPKGFRIRVGHPPLAAEGTPRAYAKLKTYAKQARLRTYAKQIEAAPNPAPKGRPHTSPGRSPGLRTLINAES
jgi:hypothetical protein